jgi:hypothetical protein
MRESVRGVSVIVSVVVVIGEFSAFIVMGGGGVDVKKTCISKTDHFLT